MVNGYNSLPKVVCNIFIKKELPIIIAKIQSSKITQHTTPAIESRNCRRGTCKLCKLGLNLFIFTIITLYAGVKSLYIYNHYFVCWGLISLYLLLILLKIEHSDQYTDQFILFGSDQKFNRFICVLTGIGHPA